MLSVQFILICALVGRINSQGWSTGDNNNYNRNYGQNDHYSNNAFGFGGSGNTLEPFRMVYEWKQLDYNWFDEMTRTQSLNNKRYIPENNALVGVKAWRDRIFVTIPRWKEGVPVTLASVPSQPSPNNMSPRLEAFPNWEMQEIGNCSALQFVQSMEIDTEGRMWIIDTGRINLMSGSGQDSRCPPKLDFLEITIHRLLSEIHLTKTISELLKCLTFLVIYLNDIVLDNSNGWYAYITDMGDDPGIIVYSLRDDRSWKVKDATSMRSDPDTNFVSVNNIDIDLQRKNLDGIALSPVMGYDRTLYYCPLGSYNLYSVPTSVLKNPNLSSDISSSVKDLGRKQSISDGMVMDNRGFLYYGLLGQNAVVSWDSNRGTRIDDGSRILARDNNLLQWPDSFAIDDSGNLYVVSNRLQNYITGRVNLNEPNYRILRAPLGIRSYMYPADTSRRGGGFDGQSNGYDNYWGSGYNSYYYNFAGTPSVNVFLLVSFSFFLIVR
ncbi:major royal jelly protein 4 precursor, putative [Pediculus humanus corporis]|uniref:Major royal jelly protein 4, putative n=1 Tax=Pediculus humanus subsp. corporis TaxID=121224 RepID=E0VCA3_PEDHC|nr:major royal jelly protein 4 precursor, putative [Pediculus humanus corporis]EEB11025.1 major royal jelly protein 4 precursor, putative [Pediculus humanus corporis]